ncbi:MAG: hypothetical protein ACFFCO_03250 [Promethearchaeota archaeon]
MAVLGLAVFEFDPQVGPKEVYRTSNVEEITVEESVAIFATHSVFSGGFRGVHIRKRTWASYIKPPWVFALLLSPDEPIGPLENAIHTTLEEVELKEVPTKREWNSIYQRLLREIKKSPASDLLTSKYTAAFLKRLLNGGVAAFEPQFSFDVGVSYPEADCMTGLNSYDTRLFLEKLALAGIFVSEPVGGALICPGCQGFKIAVRVVCSHCKASTLEVIHIVMPIVQKSDNSNSSSLASITHYSCSSCMNLTQQPFITLECTECGKQFLPMEAEFRQLFRIILEKSSAKALIQRIETQFQS